MRGSGEGLIESDTGQTSASCLTGLSSMNCNGTLPATGGSTFMAGACHAVAGYGADRRSWKFYWTPPAGTALTDATFFWGAVDGDCGMNSIRDDVKEKQFTVRRVGASRLVTPKREWAGLLGAGVGLVFSRARHPRGV